jgi:hypothetical protein
MLRFSWGKWVRLLAVLLRFWYDEYFFDALLKILSSSLMFEGNVVCVGNARFDYVI